MKIVSEEEIKTRIENKYPNQPFEIIEYFKVAKPFEIKCLKCGESFRYSSFNNFINSSRKNLCICYSETNTKNLHNLNKSKILEIINEKENLEFVGFGKKEKTNKFTIICYCKRCEQNFEKTFQDFLKYPKCFYCESKENYNNLGFQANLSEEYELLSDYKNREQSVLIRHKECGFEWKIKPKNLLHYSGCPKCNGKKSRGEILIFEWLKDHQYLFEMEKSFEWQSNLKRKYDFFLPDFNLIIEFNGQQHYFETNYFRKSYKEQSLIDKEKQEEAINQGLNYLIIGYYDINHIDSILSKWFNDYSEKK